MDEVTVSRQRLAGIGWRYDLALSHEARLVLIVEDGGRRHLMLTHDREDEPLVGVPLEHDQALALAALLTGVQLKMTGEPPSAPNVVAGQNVIVESLPLLHGSPILGLTAAEVGERLGQEAEVLGVICDQTPQILEDNPSRPIAAGDRVVVAVRKSHWTHVIAALEGAEPLT
jgi:K+/H+ antiporter YhaU regulatory subunit KhtT